MTSTELDLTSDILDVRDIIERVEFLETNEPQSVEEKFAQVEEYSTLTELLEELKDMGGDEKWRGDWYPITLIEESHFISYVQELLDDCGEIPQNLPSYVEIDWEATAKNIQVDYSTVDINGFTYFYR